MACITEAASGFPNASGHIPGECAMLPEILGERGWNTYIVGKWHLTPEDEMNMASTKKDWPLGRGFERFYGFLGAETNQWYPDIVYDNHPVDQPSLPEDGYHFSSRHHGQGDLVHPRRQGGRARQAVLPVLLRSALPTLRIRCPRSGRTSTRASSTWATRTIASSSSRTRRRWASSRQARSCRRSIRTRI